MKKVVSQLKTIKTDFSDMAKKSPPASKPAEQDPANAKTRNIAPSYDKHYIVDDLQAGTVARKIAVHAGLLLDDGVELLYRINPYRRLRRRPSAGKPAKARNHAGDQRHYDVRYRQKINILAEDDVTLSANLFAPVADASERLFPAIIFINSWLMDKHQYVLQARRFARNGYLVLSYSARGWGTSGGTIDVGGPADMRDLSAVIDWLISNAPIDPENIGTAGISYGSGLSLLGAAHDERIKTAVCMSGWADLLEAFWSQQTPRKIMARGLVVSGNLVGRPGDQLEFLLKGLLKNQRMDDVKEWARERSPITFLDKYNTRKPPIYLIQNFQDELFQPNAVLDFYSQLKAPKRIDLNLGTHTSAEIAGILGLKNHLWKQTHQWFDHWLKGVPNQVMAQAPVTCQFQRESRLRLSIGKHEGSRQALEDWPSKTIQPRMFYLDPPIDPRKSGNLATKPAKNSSTKTDVLTTIHSAPGTSKSTAGLPLFSSTKSAHLNMPLKVELAKINRRRALVFQSEPFSQPDLIVGAPELRLRIETSRPQVQLIAYLYACNEKGHGRLITHGPMTRHSVTPNKPFEVSFELVTTCYEMAPGQQLALVIDTSDLQYQIPTKDDVEVTFHYDSTPRPLLQIPFIETGR